MSQERTNMPTSSLELRSLDIPLVRGDEAKRRRRSRFTIVPAVLSIAAAMAYVLWKGQPWIS